MTPVWKGERGADLVRLALAGHSWAEIGKRLGVTRVAAFSAFQRQATHDQIETRKLAQGRRTIEPVVVAPEREVFCGKPFRDARTRDYGRAPIATDPRFSLTPSSMA